MKVEVSLPSMAVDCEGRWVVDENREVEIEKQCVVSGVGERQVLSRGVKQDVPKLRY